MRFVALAMIFLSLPIFMSALRGNLRHRDMAIMAAGILTFCTGSLDLSAGLVAWPMWQGLSKGVILSFADTLAVALIVTRPKPLPRPPFLVLIALFAAPVLISVSQAGVKEAALFIVIQIVQTTIWYIALSGELQRISAIRSLMKGLALGLIVQAGYVISQKMHGAVQAPGTTGHQNILGIMVELSALPLFGAVLEGERSKLVYLGLASALIVIAGGGSRGTMLYFAIGLVLVLALSLLRRPTSRKIKVVAISVLACLVAVPLSMTTLRERFGNAPIMQEETQRLAFERAARAIAADHPLGIGANNFVSVNNTGGYAAWAGLDWGPATRSKPAHNAYLVARAETGWAGEATLILLLGGISFAGLMAGFRRRKMPYMGVPLGCVGAIAATALHSNYEYALLLLDSQRLLFMNAALIAACITVMRRSGPGRAHSSIPDRVFATPGRRHVSAENAITREP